MSIQLELCAQCHHNKQELSAHISAYKLGVVVPTHQYINVMQTVVYYGIIPGACTSKAKTTSRSRSGTKASKTSKG